MRQSQSRQEIGCPDNKSPTYHLKFSLHFVPVRIERPSANFLVCNEMTWSAFDQFLTFTEDIVTYEADAK
jgi:hypothetical protein